MGQSVRCTLGAPCSANLSAEAEGGVRAKMPSFHITAPFPAPLAQLSMPNSITRRQQGRLHLDRMLAQLAGQLRTPGARAQGAQAQ